MNFKTTITTERRITLSETDLRIIVQGQQSVPEDWKHYSLELELMADRKGVVIKLSKQETEA